MHVGESSGNVIIDEKVFNRAQALDARCVSNGQRLSLGGRTRIPRNTVKHDFISPYTEHSVSPSFLALCLLRVHSLSANRLAAILTVSSKPHRLVSPEFGASLRQ